MAEQMSPELRDLIERHSQIQELTQHPGWSLLGDYMRAQMEAKQRSLLLGNAKTIEDYRAQTGWIKGVSDVLDAPEALAEQVEREEREERDGQRSAGERLSAG